MLAQAPQGARELLGGLARTGGRLESFEPSRRTRPRQGSGCRATRPSSSRGRKRGNGGTQTLPVTSSTLAVASMALETTVLHAVEAWPREQLPCAINATRHRAAAWGPRRTPSTTLPE